MFKAIDFETFKKMSIKDFYDLKYKEAALYFMENDISITKCAQAFCIDRMTFSGYLKSVNCFENRCVYKINENIFETIDTEEKAYWLGFILADGCLKKKNTVALSLSIKDKKHIEKFKTFLETEAPITTEDRNIKGKLYKICRLTISNKKIRQDLMRYHVMPCKSTFEQPTILRSDLIRHYIRGIFDGDGWLTYTDKSKEMGFGMGLDILIYIQTYFEANDIHFNAITPCGSIYKYRKSAKVEILKALNLLYKDSTVYLDRKFNKYNNCRSEIESSLNSAKQSQND